MERRGFTVETAYTVADGLAVARRLAPRYAVVDLRLDDGSGLEVVQALREARDDARVIVLTGYGNIATAVAAVKVGATARRSVVSGKSVTVRVALGGRRIINTKKCHYDSRNVRSGMTLTHINKY